jgi:hypothetical protein
VSAEEELLLVIVVVVDDIVPGAWRFIDRLTVLEELELNGTTLRVTVEHEAEV